MYRLQISQLIIVIGYASAEEQARISSVDDLATTAKLHEVGLVFLVAGGDEAVDFTLEFDLLVVIVGRVPFGESGLASGKR